MPANLLTCADCTTQYALDLTACPHCGSSNVEEAGAVSKRLPLFVTVSCPECRRGPWTVRLAPVTSGLVQLPTLACTSCGNQVPVTWPPEEEPMPKITAHGGATNARDADVSPVADASLPQDAAEGVLGPQTTESGVPVTDAPKPDAHDDTDPYAGLSLAELKAEADKRGVPSYGTKAQIAERLREDDASPEPEPSTDPAE